MVVVLRGRFASANETARALGVPKSRSQWLYKLLDSSSIPKQPPGKRLRTGGKSPLVRKRKKKFHGSRKTRSRYKTTR